jgi:hypothetical protein
MIASSSPRCISLARAAAALALALCSAFAAADTTVKVSIDTSLFGASGWLDMQFNPTGVGPSPVATATLTDFVGFDAAALVQTAGQVSGSLAAGYVLGNGDTWNDLFHAVQYGSVLSFQVTFSGELAMAPDAIQSVFSVSAYGADEVTLLGDSTSVDGALASITWTPASVAGQQGSVMTGLYSTTTTVSAVPEPSSWLMLGIGAMLVGAAARRRQA